MQNLGFFKFEIALLLINLDVLLFFYLTKLGTD
jgi:hypothetical protein